MVSENWLPFWQNLKILTILVKALSRGRCVSTLMILVPPKEPPSPEKVNATQQVLLGGPSK